MSERQSVNQGGVKQVRVSESSRNDARGGKPSLPEIKKALDKLDEERAALVAQKRQLQTRLAFLKNQDKSRRFNEADYQKLADEQTALTEEVNANETKLGELKVRRIRLKRDMDEEDGGKGERTETNILLRKILVELELLNGRQRAN